MTCRSLPKAGPCRRLPRGLPLGARRALVRHFSGGGGRWLICISSACPISPKRPCSATCASADLRRNSATPGWAWGRRWWLKTPPFTVRPAAGSPPGRRTNRGPSRPRQLLRRRLSADALRISQGSLQLPLSEWPRGTFFLSMMFPWIWLCSPTTPSGSRRAAPPSTA